jgi:hypothetical protein
MVQGTLALILVLENILYVRDPQGSYQGLFCIEVAGIKADLLTLP